MRNLIIKLCKWTLRRYRVFEPCIIFWPEIGITEFVMKNAGTISVPLPVGPGHCVDLEYGFEGELIGVKIWADVTTREKLEAIRLKAVA